MALLSNEVSAVMLEYRPYAGSVPWHLPVTQPEFETPGDHPVNYPVPNFGVDQDILNVKGSIAQSEKALKKKLVADFGQTGNPVNPRNYVVPDFGVDNDILRTKASVKQSEKVLGKKMKADFG